MSADNLSFTTTNWNADQTVTITGIADNLSDGDQSYAIRLTADNTTSDLGYKYVDPSDVTLKKPGYRDGRLPRLIGLEHY